jgi:hypothetical protein
VRRVVQTPEQIRLAAAELDRCHRALNRLFGEPEHTRAFLPLTFQAMESGLDVPGAMRAAMRALDERFGRAEDIKATAEYDITLHAFKAAMEQLYAPLYEVEAALKRHDESAVDSAIAFLEADSWCFRSGYMKEDFVRYLRRFSLSNPQKQRLRSVMFIAIKAGPRSEFREYCRTARIVDTPRFRRTLQRMRDDSGAEDGTRKRAGWMLEALTTTGQERPLDRSFSSAGVTRPPGELITKLAGPDESSVRRMGEER